jgi:hypothetical protein
MGIISSIRPLEIHIKWDEVTGKTDCQLSRAVPFPAIVGVFCTVIIQLAQSVMAGVSPGIAPGADAGKSSDAPGGGSTNGAA